jgi:hypothetical protein
MIAGILVSAYLGALALDLRAQNNGGRLFPQFNTLVDEYADYDAGFRFVRRLTSPRIKVASDDSSFQ